MFNSSAEMVSARNLAKDIPMMEEYINFTHPSLSDKRIPFQDYLMHWDEAKERGGLFTLFGGELIVKKHVNYIRDIDDACQHVDHYKFNSLAYMITSALRDISYELAINYFGITSEDACDLRSYIGKYTHFARQNERSFYCNSHMGYVINSSDAFHDLFDILSIFVENIPIMETWYYNSLDWYCTNGYEEFENPQFTFPNSSKKFRLTLKQKPIRALTSFVRYIESNCDSNDNRVRELLNNLMVSIENMRQFSSMLTNNKNTHGNLCISIHPFDYMTMSDRDNGWSSCMEWVENCSGEYHAGTLEMMTSPCVVVAYLEGKDPIHPSGINYNWSKKKWRELFIVDKAFITGIKGYPYHSDSLETEALKMLADLAKKNWGVTYLTDQISEVNNNALPGDHCFDTTFMYNDCCYNNISVIYADNYMNVEKNLPKEYLYGEGVYCLVCGKLRDKSEIDEGRECKLDCSDCDTCVQCSECGGYYSQDYCYQLSDGSWVCEECYENLPRLPCLRREKERW